MEFDPVNLGTPLTAKQEEIAVQAKVGFRFGAKGTHTSRTIMLEEFQTLLKACQPESTRAAYRDAVVNHNCLGKRTVATRRLTDQRLSELYALDPSVLLFRVMRRLWQAEDRGRPLLALLLALARDPLLRITAPPILRLRHGEELGRHQGGSEGFASGCARLVFSNETRSLGSTPAADSVLGRGRV